MTERSLQVATYLLAQLTAAPPKQFVEAIGRILEDSHGPLGSAQLGDSAGTSDADRPLSTSIGWLMGPREKPTGYATVAITFRKSFTDLATDFAQVLREFGATEDDFADFAYKLGQKWAEGGR